MNNYFTLLIASLFLISCGEDSVKVEPLKRGDKNLSCSEILLEINEAEFYMEQAQEKKALGIKSIVMPIGYIDTYMSADEAVGAAESRVTYLNRIYDIKNCTSSNANPAKLPAYNTGLNQPQRTAPQNNGLQPTGAPVLQYEYKENRF